MEKCSRRGGICEFEISIVFIEVSSEKQFHFTCRLQADWFLWVVEDKMEGGIEKDCTALGGLFQTIITDMRVSWTLGIILIRPSYCYYTVKTFNPVIDWTWQ